MAGRALLPVLFSFFYSSWVLLPAGAAPSTFLPADNILLNCGGTTPVTLPPGRNFLPDSTVPLPATSVSVSVSGPRAAPSDLYASSRVFTARSAYAIPVKQRGRHLLRLHLYPVVSTRFDLRSAEFSLAASELTLLLDFSFAKATPAAGPLVKEYSVAVDSETLVLTFTPSAGSVAFLNALEFISTPEGLFPSDGIPIPAGSPTEIAAQRAMETSHRVNVGGPFLDSGNDSLWRAWDSDRAFLLNPSSAHAVSVDPLAVKYTSGVSAATAPRWVYATAQEMADANVGNQRFNISWAFPVDRAFSYLVRLHFCDFVSTATNKLVFNVYINNQTAIRAFDVTSKTTEPAAAYFVDFVVDGGTVAEKMLVQIGPSDMANDQANAILNGIEILKLNNAENSLDAPSYLQNADVAKDAEKKKKMAMAFVTSSAVAISLLFLAAAAAIFRNSGNCRRRWRRKMKMQLNNSVAWLTTHSLAGNSESKISINTFASSGPGRVLAFSEIREATKNFDEGLVLGIGGFGKVYKGVLENGDVVAVKRGNPRSQQGLVEFRTEIEMLTKLRHRHLVSLIGYCQEPDEMVLVYEYMAGGSLRKHLYGSDLPTLSWKQRLEICIGAAKGLHYLHTGAAATIIHRDVKTTNILLDGNLVAKVADFGLSKMGPSLDQTHVSTAVKGSFGYLDPEYFRRQRLTEKSDVYSFGVVLMEVLCARPAINPALPRDQVNIAEWAMNWQKRGQLEHIIDPHLVGNVCPDSLRIYGETAEKCLGEHGVERPAMGDVLWSLEYALQLQESFAGMGAAGEEDSANAIHDLPDWIPSVDPVVAAAEHSRFRSVVDAGGSDATSTSGVFSQIINPRGR